MTEKIMKHVMFWLIFVLVALIEGLFVMTMPDVGWWHIVFAMFVGGCGYAVANFLKENM